MPTILLAAGLTLGWGFSDWAADSLLHPVRWTLEDARRKGNPAGPADVQMPFVQMELTRPDGARLAGWLIRGKRPSRGLLVWMHRLNDNRASALWIAPRFGALGFDILAFDARAHGESGGAQFTYGFLERDDLVMEIAMARDARTDAVVLIGNSVGGAVAIQAAPLIGGLKAVVAAGPFESLESMARARKPWYATEGMVRKALAEAEERGQFPVAEVSPLRSALSIRAPLLVLAGSADRIVPPEQGRRVADAAPAGRFLQVPGADHPDLLSRPEAWNAIEEFVLEATR